jgi:hypothetical protein
MGLTSVIIFLFLHSPLFHSATIDSNRKLYPTFMLNFF